MKIQAYLYSFSFWIFFSNLKIFLYPLNNIWSNSSIIKYKWEILLSKNLKPLLRKEP